MECSILRIRLKNGQWIKLFITQHEGERTDWLARIRGNMDWFHESTLLKFETKQNTIKIWNKADTIWEYKITTGLMVVEFIYLGSYR
jgi:hypothetical protein